MSFQTVYHFYCCFHSLFISRFAVLPFARYDFLFFLCENFGCACVCHSYSELFTCNSNSISRRSFNVVSIRYCLALIEYCFDGCYCRSAEGVGGIIKAFIFRHPAECACFRIVFIDIPFYLTFLYRIMPKTQ